MSGILVGVDGPDHSRRALSWAMREAAHHHVPLTVMTVRPAQFARPQFARPPRSIGMYPTFPIRALIPRAREWRSKDGGRGGEGSRRDTARDHCDRDHGDPADELINASYDAGMLVVGSRGSGVFAKLLIGSVSSKVTHHAASPVVVIPAAG